MWVFIFFAVHRSKQDLRAKPLFSVSLKTVHSVKGEIPISQHPTLYNDQRTRRWKSTFTGYRREESTALPTGFCCLVFLNYFLSRRSEGRNGACSPEEVKTPHCSCGAQTSADYMKLIRRETGALVLGQAGLDEGIAQLWAASWRSGTNLTHDVHSLLRGIVSYDPRLVSVVDSALLLFYWIFDHCVFIYSSSNTESHNFSHSS